MEINPLLERRLEISRILLLRIAQQRADILRRWHSRSITILRRRADQAAQHRLLFDDLRVIVDVGRRRHRIGQLRQIADAADILQLLLDPADAPSA